jgi:hypothetical protein
MGIMVLYTPLGGSRLNMAESIQRILVRRALAGEHPRKPEQTIERVEGAARGWNRDPTPFEWGGRRAERRACPQAASCPGRQRSSCPKAATKVSEHHREMAIRESNDPLVVALYKEAQPPRRVSR